MASCNDSRVHITASAAFLTFLVLPCLQQATGIVPVTPLAGVEEEAKLPALSARDWFDGRWQAGCEACFNSRLGFRSWLVKTHNQIHFSIFRTVSSSRGTKVVLGRENWLYEKAYVDACGRAARVDRGTLERAARDMRRLQDRLEARGVGFLLLVSPNKARLYPEYLPKTAIAERNRGKAPDDYRLSMAAFHSAGVRCVDGAARFQELRKTAPHPLFARGGVHWNYYGLALLMEEVASRLNTRMARSFPAYVLSGVELTDPVGPDNDLGRLLNIWTWRAVVAPTPYPTIRTERAGRSLPRLLVVGDSFCDVLNDGLLGRWRSDRTAAPEAARFCERIEFLYYCKTLVTYPGGARRPFDLQHADWQALVGGQDAVMLVINEINLPDGDGGFVDAANAALRAATARAGCDNL